MRQGIKVKIKEGPEEGAWGKDTRPWSENIYLWVDTIGVERSILAIIVDVFGNVRSPLNISNIKVVDTNCLRDIISDCVEYRDGIILEARAFLKESNEKKEI